MEKWRLPFMGFVLLWCLASATVIEAEYLKYKDPKQPLNVRVSDLFNRMTLEEKIGQMVQIERENTTREVVNKYFIGSVLSGGGSVPAPKASAEAWIGMVNNIQKGALSTRLDIPMIYGIDAVHGHNNVYKATIFPHNVGLRVTRQVFLIHILDVRHRKILTSEDFERMQDYVVILRPSSPFFKNNMQTNNEFNGHPIQRQKCSQM